MITFYVIYSDDSREKIEAEDYGDLEKKILASMKEKDEDITLKDFWRE